MYIYMHHLQILNLPRKFINLRLRLFTQSEFAALLNYQFVLVTSDLCVELVHHLT